MQSILIFPVTDGCRFTCTILLFMSHVSAASGSYKQQVLKQTQFCKLHRIVDYKQDMPFDKQDHLEEALSEFEIPSTSDIPVSAALAMRTWTSGEAPASPAASKNSLHASLLQQLGQQHPGHRSALFCDPGEACESVCMPVL